MTQEKNDQAAPISSDDLRELMGAATPRPWNVTAPVEGSPDFMVIQHGPYGFSECGKYLSVSGKVSGEDASLISLAPYLAAEVLARRADLAAPSAPADQAGRWETDMEHTARDMREGRFPERSERQRIAVPSAQHPDDAAVDRFAVAMKAKLAKKRADGRGGWEGSTCSEAFLSKLLREHVEKGDPLDVGNLAMMLHQRGERIAANASADKAEVERDEARTHIDVLESYALDMDRRLRGKANPKWIELHTEEIIQDIAAADNAAHAKLKGEV